jgi:hypothetical protein
MTVSLENIKHAAFWASCYHQFDLYPERRADYNQALKDRVYDQSVWGESCFPECDKACCMWGAACLVSGIEITDGPDEEWCSQSTTHQLIAATLRQMRGKPKQVIAILDGNLKDL